MGSDFKNAGFQFEGPVIRYHFAFFKADFNKSPPDIIVAETGGDHQRPEVIPLAGLIDPDNAIRFPSQ